MFRTLLVASFLGSASVAVAAGPQPDPAPSSRGLSCAVGPQHVSMLAEAQMCPRPLATTIIAPVHHRLLHT